jgi:myo-inositol-1(or 4)-monophosphatase
MNYSRGLPIWCVSLALFRGVRPVVGAIYDPLRNELFSAAEGLGARSNGRALTTSGRKDVASAVIHITIDFEAESMASSLEDVRRLAPRALRTRNIGSAALALAYVADGRFDAMLHRFAHAWDYGAGVVMIHEAGGSVVGVDGEPYTMRTTALIAAASPELALGLREIVGASGGARLE